MKVVINTCYGGFGLSVRAEQRLAELGCEADIYSDLFRANPLLVRVVEELGEKADGPFAKLKVINIPDGVEWEISKYDGVECVEEKHRKWS